MPAKVYGQPARALFGVFVSLIIGCTSRDSNESPHAEAAPTPAASAAPAATADTICIGYRECLRAAEPRELSKRRDVRRDSLRLIFETSTGQPTVLEDGPIAQEDRHYYLYNGWDAALRAHRVYLMEYESSAVLYVFPTSGRAVSLDNLPTISPDGRFVATGSWDTEADHEPNRAQIFIVQRDTLVLAWEIAPTLWGPDSLWWANDSTLMITRGAAYRHPNPEQLSAPVRVSFQRGAWHADSSGRAP